MWRLKFSFVLPAAQLLIAVVLIAVGNRVPGPRVDSPWIPTVRLVCHGINAPVAPLGLLGILLERVDRRPPSILGFGAGEIFFLAGVVLLWYLVGRALDRRKSPPQGRITTSQMLLNLFLIVWGVCLFFLGLPAFQSPWRYSNRVGNLAEGILFSVWSLILVLVLGANLVKAIRRRHSHSDAST